MLASVFVTGVEVLLSKYYFYSGWVDVGTNTNVLVVVWCCFGSVS